MKTYKELSAELKSNHANCEAIEKEMDGILPDEIYVAIFDKAHKDKDGKMYAYTTPEMAKETFSSLVEKVVRYVLPPQDQAIKECVNPLDGAEPLDEMQKRFEAEHPKQY